MSTDDLRAEFCERLTGACVAKGFKLDEQVPPMATVEAH